MGYYGDCRDCVHFSSIHRAGSGHACEFICGYSKVEMDDVYGDTCRNFIDAAAVEAARQREQDRNDAEAFVTGWYLGENADDIIPGVLVIGAIIIAVGIWDKLSASASPVAVTIKGIISLYILYKIFLKWLFKLIDFVGKKIWGKSFYEQMKTLGASIVASFFVTWIFTSIYNIRYYFTCFMIFAFIIQKYFIRDWMEVLREKLKK